MKIIPAKLKELRIKHKYTQTDLIKKLSVPPTTYKGWESGLRNPDMPTIYAIGRAFGLTKREITEEIVSPEEINIEDFETECPSKLKHICEIYKSLGSEAKQKLADEIIEKLSQKLDDIKNI